MSLPFRRRWIILVITAIATTTYLVNKNYSNLSIMADKVVSLEEVSKHTTADSAWVVIEGKVYDVTEFLEDHPGGKKILLQNCGKDSTELFQEYHTKQILRDVGGPMMIGQITEGTKL